MSPPPPSGAAVCTANETKPCRRRRSRTDPHTPRGTLLLLPPARPRQVDRATAAAAGAAVAQNRLADKVAGILSRVERELDDADSKIGDSLRVLDMDNDGIVSQSRGRGRGRGLLGLLFGGALLWLVADRADPCFAVRSSSLSRRPRPRACTDLARGAGQRDVLPARAAGRGGAAPDAGEPERRVRWVAGGSVRAGGGRG